MTQLVQKVSADGIHLPKELIEQCGVTEGHEVVIELEDSTIRITPAQVDELEVDAPSEQDLALFMQAAERFAKVAAELDDRLAAIEAKLKVRKGAKDGELG